MVERIKNVDKKAPLMKHADLLNGEFSVLTMDAILKYFDPVNKQMDHSLLEQICGESFDENLV